MSEEQTDLLSELKRRKVVRVGIAYVVVAWVALQFFDLVLDNIEAPLWVMQAVMALLAVGFPVSLVLAWVFDVTPDGVRAAPGRSRAFAGLVAVISVGVLGYVGWSYVGSGARPDSIAESTGEAELRVIDSIAVLPFESFSTNREDEYFADGLADTLLHKLSQLSNLKVIARNSSFQFKGSNKDAREIGEILGVVALLEGSVQRQGDQVRVIAQLIDTADGTHLWSQTFDDSLLNIFELQDRIAEAIMEQLQITISARDRQLALRNGTDSPEAYDLLLQATQLDLGVDRASFDPQSNRALRLVDAALEIDPGYAQAWETRSLFFSSALFFNTTSERSRAFLDAAMSAAERAIEAAPEYAGGYARRGWAHLRSGNIPAALQDFTNALERNPNELSAMQGLGLIKVNDDPLVALDLFTRSRELDPQDPFVYRQMFFALDALGRLDEGMEALQEGIRRFPDEPVLKMDLAYVYLDDRGKIVDAAVLASQILADDGRNRLGLWTMISVWAAAGDFDRAARWLDIASARFPDSSRGPEGRAYLELLSGDPAEARRGFEAIPETAEYLFDRSTDIAGVCLIQGDGACLRDHATRMQSSLERFAESGRSFAPAGRYRLAIAILNNAAVAPDDRDTDELQALLVETEDWPLTGGFRFVRYARVMLESLLGEDEQAVRELQKTLAIGEGAFLHEDIFDLPPDMNPLITRLQGVPGYDRWLRDYSGRREQARGTLVRMERDGDIIAAANLPR